MLSGFFFGFFSKTLKTYLAKLTCINASLSRAGDIMKGNVIMEKYIGTKILSATPMNLGEYNKHRGWTIPEDEDPASDGYLVEYPDGYQSWSPVEVFESAYRKTDAMNFGLAIEAMLLGKKVVRSSWNGKNMWVCFMPPVLIDSGIVNGRTRKFIPEDTDLDCQGYLVMWNAQGKLQPGWTATQSDMLANDWEIVE